MALGKAQIIPEAGGVFSLVWELNEEIQPGGVQVGLATLTAAFNALKPLAAALAPITSVAVSARTSTSVGRANLNREAASKWTLVWMVDNQVSGAPQSGLTLTAAIDALAALIPALAGTLQLVRVAVQGPQ